MHHQDAFQPATPSNICVVEPKDFIPLEHIDWFKKSIPTLNTFEECNMANISSISKYWPMVILPTLGCFSNHYTIIYLCG
jgi:hypothetical protein